MKWDIDFINEKAFRNHIYKTIQYYGAKLCPYDLQKYNANVIDPVKMLFDQNIYQKSWQEIITAEVMRQRDKSNANEIGYFHQNLFKYISGCTVPKTGKSGGWDIIYESPSGYIINQNNIVHKIFVEMKNKHNTMNSSSAKSVFKKMQAQILEDDDCACFLVEVIAKKSQNIIWEIKEKNQKNSHCKIRRVSIDKFYEIVTGDANAFFKICMKLPVILQDILSANGNNITNQKDTAYEEFKTESKKFTFLNYDEAMIMTNYMLGFGTYNGFAHYNQND